MTNPLANIYGGAYNPQAGGNYNSQGSNFNPSGANFNPQTNTQTLPNGGGTFNPQIRGGAIAPAPIFTPQVETPTAPVEPEVDYYAKYRDPKTGEIMSPEEYAIYLGNKVPKGTGEISNYAGDAMTNPNQTAQELTSRATNLNNSRNDIASGTTDPYGVGNKSGIAYSPTELKAIENAYAGIYDPALNDVFARLKTKQAEEEKKAAREERVFATNEAIRQWRATTGTKSSGDGASKDLFTQSQLNDGASNSGLSVTAFSSLDDDIKNFFVNIPTDYDEVSEKSYPMDVVFENLISKVKQGKYTIEEATSEMTKMKTTPAVKQFYIEQLDGIEPEKKESILSEIWNWISGN